MKSTLIKRIVSISLCLTAFLSLAMVSSAGVDNNIVFSFRIVGGIQKAQNPQGELRETTDPTEAWKIRFYYSEEGIDTISQFWIENGSGQNASNTYDLQQGDPARYKPANSKASNTTVYLTGKNNEPFSSEEYTVKGFWDEETGVFV